MNYRLFSWGESMYGGYYAELLNEDNGKVVGFHADTQRELKSKTKEYGVEKFDKEHRWDN